MGQIHLLQRSISLTVSKEFQRKQLATHAVNTGLLCGHGCKYCSTPALIRTHQFFVDKGISSFKCFEQGDSIVDPWTHIRLADKCSHLKDTDVVMLGTITDCWSHEAQAHSLGRRILETLLTKSKCKIRILTKNAGVLKDFDLLCDFKDRVSLGMSITAPRSEQNIIVLLEPRASLIEERLDTLEKANQLGIKTFAMFCPIMPGIASDPDSFDSMVKEIKCCNPESVWAEPINQRGKSIIKCIEELRSSGLNEIANQFSLIRNRQSHLNYTYSLVNMMSSAFKRHGMSHLLKILVYSKGDGFIGDDSSVIWLKR